MSIDGAADFKPIAHLYRSQVYHLGVPQEIRPPLLVDDAVRL
ncbi:hypothetical protein [Rhodopseudomonas palustris]|nr:hypothetical protein [Rhodopseudomonas palustris]